MKKIKKLFLILILLFIGGVGSIMAGCTTTASSVSLSLSGLTNNEVVLTIGENESANVEAKIEGYNDSISRGISFSTDSTCIKIVEVKYYSNGRAVAKIVGLTGGTAEVKVQTHEFGKVQTFNVIVLEPVSSISIKKDLQMFFEDGQEKLYLDPELIVDYFPVSTTEKEVDFVLGENTADNEVLAYDSERQQYYVENIREDTEIIAKSRYLTDEGKNFTIRFRNKINLSKMYNEGTTVYDSESENLSTFPTLQIVKNQVEYSNLQVSLDIDCSEANMTCFVVHDNNVIVELLSNNDNYFTFAIQSTNEKNKSVIEFHFVADGYEYVNDIIYLNVNILEAPKNLKVNGYSNITEPIYVYTGYEASVGEKLTFSATPDVDIAGKMYLILDTFSSEKLAVYDSIGAEIPYQIISTKYYYEIPSNNVIYLKATQTIQSQFYVTAMVEYVISNQRFESVMSFPIITLEEIKSIKYYYTNPATTDTFEIEEVCIDIASNNPYKDINFYSGEDNDYLTDFSILNESNIAKVDVLDRETLRVTALGTGNSYFKIVTGNGFESRINVRFIKSLNIDKIKIDLQETYQNENIIKKSYFDEKDSFYKKVFEAEIIKGSTVPILYTLNQEGVSNLKVRYAVDDERINIYYNNNTYYIQALEETDDFVECSLVFTYRNIENAGQDNEISQDKEFVFYFSIKAYIKLEKFTISTSKNSNDFILYDYNSVGFFNDNLSRAIISTAVYPEILNKDKCTLTWSTNAEAGTVFENGSVLGFDEYGNRIYPYTFNTTTGELICRVDTEELPVAKISITATLEYEGVFYSKSIQFSILRAKRVEEISIKTDEVVLNYDSQNANISYTFKPKTNPADAYSPKLSCMFIPLDEKTTSDLFSIKEISDGFVVSYNSSNNENNPQKSGEGYIRLIALDSYLDANTYTVYVDIPISLRDGTFDSPIQIVTAKQFVEIQDFSLHYQIVGTIDLSGYSLDEYAGNVLTGSLTGISSAEITGIKLNKFLTKQTDEGETSYVFSSLFSEIIKENENTGLIKDIKFTASVDSTITRIGNGINLFYKANGEPQTVYVGVVSAVNSGTLENVSVCLKSSVINIHASILNYGYDLKVGGVVAKNQGLITNNLENSPTYTNLVYTSNDSSFNINDNIDYSISPKNTNTKLYFGGVAGENSGTIERKIPVGYSFVNGSGDTTNVNLQCNILKYGKNYDSFAPDDRVLRSAVGGIVGNNDSGILEGLASQGEITAPRIDNVGGVAGYSKSDISNCKSGTFVLGNYYVGGLVGQQNNRDITNCKVEALETKSAKKTLVVGNDYVGGLVGYVNTGCKIESSYFISFITSYNVVNYNSSLGYTQSNFYGDVLLMSTQHSKDTGDGLNVSCGGLLVGQASEESNLSLVYGDGVVQYCTDIKRPLVVTANCNEMPANAKYVMLGYVLDNTKALQILEKDNENNDVINSTKDFYNVVNKNIFKQGIINVGAGYDYTFIITAPTTLGVSINPKYLDSILNKNLDLTLTDKEILEQKNIISLYFYYYKAKDDTSQSNIDFMNKLNKVFGFTAENINAISSNSEVVAVDGVSGIKVCGIGQTILTFSSVYNANVNQKILINVVNYIGEMTIHQSADRTNPIQDNSSIILDLDNTQMLYTYYNEKVGKIETISSVGAGLRVVVELREVEINGVKYLVQFGIDGTNESVATPLKIFYGNSEIASYVGEIGKIENYDKSIHTLANTIELRNEEGIQKFVFVKDKTEVTTDNFTYTEFDITKAMYDNSKLYTVEYSLDGKPKRIYTEVDEVVKKYTKIATNTTTYFLGDTEDEEGLKEARVVLGTSIEVGNLIVNGKLYVISKNAEDKFVATYTDISNVELNTDKVGFINENHIPNLDFELIEVGTKGSAYLIVPTEKCETQNMFIVEYVEFTTSVLNNMVSYKLIGMRDISFALDSVRIIGNYLSYNGTQYIKSDKDSSTGVFWDTTYFTLVDGVWIETTCTETEEKIFERNNENYIPFITVKDETNGHLVAVETSSYSVINNALILTLTNKNETTQNVWSSEDVEGITKYYLIKNGEKLEILTTSNPVVENNVLTLVLENGYTNVWKIEKLRNYQIQDDKLIPKISLNGSLVRVNAFSYVIEENRTMKIELKNTSLKTYDVWTSKIIGEITKYYLVGESEIEIPTLSYEPTVSENTLILTIPDGSWQISKEKVVYNVYDIKNSEIWLDYKIIQGTKNITAKTYEIIATPQDEASFDIHLDTENTEEEIDVKFEILNYNDISDGVSNDNMFEILVNNDDATSSVVFNANESKSTHTISAEQIKDFAFRLKIRVNEKYRSFVDQRYIKITLTAKSNGCSTDLFVKFNPQPVVAVLADLYNKTENSTDTANRNYFSYISTNKIVPGENSLLELNVFPEFVGFNYIEITNVNNDYNIMFDKVNFDNKTEIINKKIDSNTHEMTYFLGEKLEDAKVVFGSSINVGKIKIGGKEYEITKEKTEFFATYENSEFLNRNTVNLYSITNGVRIYNPSFTNGMIQLRAFVSSDIDDEKELNLLVKVFDYKNSEIYEQTIKFYSDQPPGVQLTLKDTKSSKTTEEAIENRLFVARGVSYDLGMKLFDFNYDQVIFTISKPEYITIIRDSNDKFYFKITNSEINYPIGENGYDVTISAYGSKIEENVIVESDMTYLRVTIVEFVLNNVSANVGSVIENVENGVYKSSVGNIINLSVSFSKQAIEYSENIQEVLTSVENLQKELSTNGTWKVKYKYSDKDVYLNTMSGKTAENQDYIEEFLSTFNYKWNPITNYHTLTFLKTIKSSETLFEFKFEGSFEYKNGKPTYYSTSSSIKNTISESFVFDVFQRTDSRSPFPIYTYSEMLNMRDGSYYILMNDITIKASEYTPISASVGGFDGNNKNITFENFSYTGITETNTRIGLFSVVAENSIIQNVKIYVKNTLTIDASSYETLTFGLLAAENNGKITNCSIEGTNSSLINFIVGDYGVEGESNHTLAAFVGRNSGYITNSRVEVSFKSTGSIGGFVCSNSGTIRACYMSNGAVTNQSSLSKTYTAGFVLHNDNGGLIDGCYISGIYLKDSDQFANDITKAINSSYSCASFVYTNDATIIDCYANIPVTTKAMSSGFVFRNNNIATITNCYSTSKMENNTSAHTSFVGVIQNVHQNFGTLTNCFSIENADVNPTPTYKVEQRIIRTSQMSIKEENITCVDTKTYLQTFNLSIGVNRNIPGLTVLTDTGEIFRQMTSGTSYIDVYLVEKGNLAIEKISNKSLFEDAGFITTTNSYRTAGTWFFPTDSLADADFEKNGTGMSFKYLRPELVSANTIAVRERILDVNNPVTYDPLTNEEIYHYLENSNYAYGTKFNPYIIANASDLELIVEDTNNGVTSGYYRMICDLDYETDKITASKLYKVSITGELDGNNFTISNFVIDTNETLENAGLFASIGTVSNQKGIVKNLTLAPRYINAPNAYSLGALSGTVYGASVVSVEIDGKSSVQTSNTMILLGRNIVGGLTGKAFGTFNIKDIISNISINSTYRASLQGSLPQIFNGYNTNQVSYGGVVIGMVYGAGTVSDLYITKDCVSIAENAGLYFGSIANTAIVKNIFLTRTDKQFVKPVVYGGLIAGVINDATLQNVNIIETLTISNIFVSEPFYPKSIGIVAGYMNKGIVEDINVKGIAIQSTTSEITAGVIGLFEEGTMRRVCLIDVNVSGNATVGGLVGVVGTLTETNTLGLLRDGNSVKIENSDFLQGSITAKSDRIDVYSGLVVGRVVLLGQNNIIGGASAYGNVIIQQTNNNRTESMTATKMTVTTTNITDATNVYIGTIGGTQEKCYIHNPTAYDVYGSGSSSNANAGIRYIATDGSLITKKEDRWRYLMQNCNFDLTFNWVELDRTTVYFEGDKAIAPDYNDGISDYKNDENITSYTPNGESNPGFKHALDELHHGIFIV